MIVGWLIAVDFLVVFFSLKGDTPVDTPDTQRPFLHLDYLAQQLSILGTLLGRAVQTESASVTNSLSRSVQSGGGQVS